MALTDSLVTMSYYVLGLLQDATWMQQNGVTQVLYGDQEKVGQVPLICVEPSQKSRQLNGAPRRTEVDMEINVIVYYGILQDNELNRKGADLLAEAVEARLHSDSTCGSLAIASLVSNLSSGVANKGGSLYKASRLTFTTNSQVQLPYSYGG